VAQQSGVEIYKKFYPWPTRFRVGDPVLVREVTGMSWPEFAAALDEMEQEGGTMDQVVLAGMIAVAFWQGNPQMTRERVRRAVERIPQDDLELIDGDEDDAEGVDAGPPVGQDAGSSMTSSESDVTQAVMA
jgi:hypothetical protein